MRSSTALAVFMLSAALFAATPVRAQAGPPTRDERSPESWIALGEAVHGGFGSHIALGILIGQDALRRLGAGRREVVVTVTEGKNAPCACLADGVMVATSASPGQRTLTVAPRSDDAGFMALVDVRSGKSGRTVSYRVPASAIGPLAQMNPGKTSREKFDLVMSAPPHTLFEVVER